MTTTITRYHDISCGHRVVGHEGKCRLLHGHNYRIHFTCQSDTGLDNVGRVIDFSAVKERLCMWLEDNWDHKFIAWGYDNFILHLCSEIERTGSNRDAFTQSVVWVPFNPTAENMAQFLVNTVGPAQLQGTGVKLISVTIEETAKCSATYTLEPRSEMV